MRLFRAYIQSTTGKWVSGPMHDDVYASSYRQDNDVDQYMYLYSNNEVQCVSLNVLVHRGRGQVGSKNLVPNCKDESKVRCDLGVMDAMWYSATEYHRDPVIRRPPDIMPRMLLKEKAYKDTYVNPKCKRMNRTQQPRIHNHTKSKDCKLKRMYPTCSPCKEISLEAMMNVVHIRVKKTKLVMNPVLPVDQEVTNQQRDAQVTKEFPYSGSFSRHFDMVRINVPH